MRKWLRATNSGLDIRAAIWTCAGLAGLTLLVGQMAQARALKGQDESLARIEVALAQANVKVGQLNDRLDHLTTIDDNLAGLTQLTLAIEREVRRSARLTARTDRQTGGLVGAVGGVNLATNRIDSRLGGLGGQTTALAGQVATLKATVDPLAFGTRGVRGSLGEMDSSLDRLNGSLRYVIRILNYLAAPPAGGSFSVQVTLDRRTLPPLEGVTVDTAPIAVFRRGAWAQYRGP